MFNRRDAIKVGLGSTLATCFIRQKAFGEEDQPNPRAKRFLLYIHFGSICGMSAGLVQPHKAGEWPKGFFKGGSSEGCANSNVNAHKQVGNFVFHGYLRHLEEITNDMCLANGDSVSLDHGVAANLQRRGVEIAAFAPEWAMGVAEFMRTDKTLNPLMISKGQKTSSVGDIVTLSAKNIDEFSRVTRDAEEVANGKGPRAIWDVFKERYAATKINSVSIKEKALNESITFQMNTLLNGLPELDAIKNDIDSIKKAITVDNAVKLLERNNCVDIERIRNELKDQINGLGQSLILAAALAKAGVAHGLTTDAPGGDLHTGGTDYDSPPKAAASWALITLFWQWIKSAQLDENVLVVASHEFSRAPYNGSFSEGRYRDINGKEQTIKAYGRDHGIYFGTIFLNKNVPSGGRIGNIVDGLTPLTAIDAKGGVGDKSLGAHRQSAIVGSMLMRVFDDLFPTERMVRKHWPDFKEIAPLLK